MIKDIGSMCLIIGILALLILGCYFLIHAIVDMIRDLVITQQFGRIAALIFLGILLTFGGITRFIKE